MGDTDLRKLVPRRPGRAATREVWYAAYGSNVHRSRLGYYLTGGKPPGGRWACPGSRDRRQPARTVPVMLPGGLYFALESRTWTGGMAFYDPDAAGEAAAHAYLVTAEQFSDIAAQEMHRDPGPDLDLTRVLAHGRAAAGPGRYETLVCAGELDERPVLTFTAPWGMHDVPWNAPAAGYLRWLASGLRASHDWSAERVATYLARRPGAAMRWTAAEVAALI